MFRLTTLACLALSAAAFADVTAFQQGRSPAEDYAGCIDTTMRGRGWARERARPEDATLATYADAVPILRFDVSAIGKDRYVNRAILRLYYSQVPSPPAQLVEVRTLTHEWDENATWFEYSYADGAKSEKNNWATPGG